MKRRIAAAVALPILLVLDVALAANGSGTLDPAACTSTATSDQTDDGGTPLTTDQLTDAQLANARIIYTVAAQRGLPTRAAVIALATALQESRLINLDQALDHDSLGLFQQRPSQGWGTPAEILDPVHASNAFYDHLLRVGDWQNLTVTQAAQAVQRSAYPNAYAKWEPLATELAATIGANTPTTTTDAGTCDDEGDGLPSGAGISLPSDITLPAGTPTAVVTAIAWALAQLGTPYHFGGDCTNPHAGVPARQCDCSSLMQQAYRAAGINIPRTTLDQVHTGVAVTDLAAIAPGDLVFIPGSEGSRSVPRHVGMYIGNGLIIQAPHTGDVVKISTLASWRSGISAVRRAVYSDQL